MAKVAVFIYNRKRVDYVVPNDVVSFFKGGTVGCGDEFLKWSHKFAYFIINRHTAYSVITTCYNT